MTQRRAEAETKKPGESLLFFPGGPVDPPFTLQMAGDKSLPSFKEFLYGIKGFT